MKLYLVTIILSICVVSIQSRPQTVQWPFHQNLASPYLLQPNSDLHLSLSGRNFMSISYSPYGSFFQQNEIPTISPTLVPRLLSSVPENTDHITPKRLPLDTMKLIDGRSKKTTALSTPQKLKAEEKRVMSLQFIQAVEQPDNKFKIEKFYFVPKNSTGPQVQSARLQNESDVKVSAIASTSADVPNTPFPNIPDVPSIQPFYGPPMTDNREEATLILEPNSRAIAGNGGTAISSPVSRAVLRYGSKAKILFRPQSVAIVGAYGKAHAQADLIVDYVK